MFRVKWKVSLEISLYSHAPYNDVYVNNGLHIRWWSHKIIMECKQKVYFQCGKKRLDSITMLNLLLALGGLNRWGGSACCPPVVYRPTRGAGVDEGVRAGEEAAWSCLHQRLHTHSCAHAHFPFLCFSFSLSSQSAVPLPLIPLLSPPPIISHLKL